jgi:hypothetical protein
MNDEIAKTIMIKKEQKKKKQLNYPAKLVIGFMIPR